MKRMKLGFSNRPEDWFLRSSLLFGLLFVFIVPPFQAPDETSHFFRAYHLSEGHLMGETTSDKRLGAELPSSLQELYLPFAHLRYNYDARITAGSLERAASVGLDAGRRTFVDFANVGYYAPFPYLVYALPIALLRHLGVPPLFMLYAGRLSGLLLWVVVLFYAVRGYAFHRWTIALCALLPASVVLHSSLSGDTLTNALAFFLTARLTGLIFDRRRTLSAAEGGILALSGGVITVSKVVFAPLIALCWLIPERKFGSRGSYLFWCGSLSLLHVLLLLIWYRYAGEKFIPYSDYHPVYRDAQQLNPGVDPPAQLDFIMEHPLRFLGIVMASYRESLPATLAHYTGKFGWEKNYLPAPLIALLLLSLFVMALFEDKRGAIPALRQRLFFLCTAMIMSLALAAVQYMQWHPVSAPRILSLQGRYFIPVLPLVWLALKQRKRTVDQNLLLCWTRWLVFISLIWTCWSVLDRYYLL